MMEQESKKIIGIWAEAENGVIGKNQGMPWYLPAELEHFKKTTMNQVILMGRVTFDGMNRRLLPRRQTIILTRDADFHCDGVLSFTSVEAVLDWFRGQDKDLYIAGGANIYKLFESYYDRIVKTVVHSEIEGDTYFPQIDLTNFRKISEQTVLKDEHNCYDFTVTVWERKGEK